MRMHTLRIHSTILFSLVLISLICCFRIYQAGRSISGPPAFQTGRFAVKTNQNHKKEKEVSLVGKTKIITFINEGFKVLGAAWCERLKTLGYDEQTITVVALDNATADYLSSVGCQQYELRTPNDLPEPYASNTIMHSLYKTRQLYADRWVYMLEQLEKGIHVLMTDADDIFAKYVPTSDFEDSEFDVFHSYATNYPREAFREMLFVACGCLSWWRADPKVIAFVRMMVDTRGPVCDDQVVLNNELLAEKANMTWDQSIEERRMNYTGKYRALLERGVTGTSGFGHRVKFWDRTVASAVY